MIFNENLKVLEEYAFCNSRLEKVVSLSKIFMTVHKGVFIDCNKLKFIYVSDKCNMFLSDENILNFTQVGPPSKTMAGTMSVWNLRALKNVNIPEGVDRIGNHWFYGSEIKNIVIAASVKSIGF